MNNSDDREYFSDEREFMRWDGKEKFICVFFRDL